jgi:hypothetical protein
MTIDNLIKFLDLFVKLVGHLAYPIVILLIARTLIKAFKPELSALITRIRKGEIGGFAFEADPIKLEKGLEITQQETASIQEKAQQLLEQAIEDRELRVMRGLVGETQGRTLDIYQKSDFYRPAITSLLAKGLIRLRQQNNTYVLTDLGKAVMRQHMTKALS